jgi:predicted phosphodiesterase
MRFAALSDIHGNLPALEAVIADLKRRGIDHVVSLGDSLSGPLWPVETAERLIDLGWLSLAGNHERQLLTWPLERMKQTDAATAPLLTPRIRQWMADLPSSFRLTPDILLCHGTPQEDDRYWLHRGKRGAMREASVEEIAAFAVDATLSLCGHSHLPRAISLSDGRVIANPGSVGLPAYEDMLPRYQKVDSDEPEARYLIASHGAGGWDVDLVSVPYDYEMSARKAEQEDRPTWAEALRTGMVR